MEKRLAVKVKKKKQKPDIGEAFATYHVCYLFTMNSFNPLCPKWPQLKIFKITKG